MNEIFYLNGEYWDNMQDMAFNLYFDSAFTYGYDHDDIMGMYLMGNEL